MSIQKLSISLPQQQFDFIELYQASHHYKTRSEVIKKALSLLQQVELEACYRDASSEVVDDAFDITNMDGLDDHETW